MALGPRDGFATLTAGRNRLVVGAITGLVLIGVLGGGSVAAVRLIAPHLGNSTLASVAGTKHAEAVSTRTEHATPTLTGAAIAATKTASAVVAPPTATAVPHPPTATPISAVITLNTNAPQTQSSSNNTNCYGTVILTNSTGGPVSWSLLTPSGQAGDSWVYQVDNGGLRDQANGTIPSGQTSKLKVIRYGGPCASGSQQQTQQFSVLVNSAAVASFTFKY
jgi:hypothetical protein